MTPQNVKNVLNGAILGSLLGSVSAMLITNQKLNRSDWAQKAKNFGETVINEVKHWSGPESEVKEEGSIFAKGAIIGLLIGAGSALLLSPKTGSQLRNELIRGYRDLSNYVNHKTEMVKRIPIKRVISKAKQKAKRAVKDINKENKSHSRTAGE